jgi:hypothetical protein
VLYDLRTLADEPGRLFLQMLVEGGCGCGGPAVPGPRLRRFRVLGQAELEPGERKVEKKSATLRWRVKAPRYFVMASCRSCEGKPPAEAAQAPVGPCGEPCAPLGQGVAAWGQEVGHAQRELEGLAEKTTALELDLGTKRNELAGAESARRRPPSLLRRIAALQEQVKATQSELSRISSAAKEAQERLAELRRAVDDSQAADQRCQSQCQARQRAPEKAAGGGQAGTATGGAGAAAGGGGLGSGAVIVGGAVAAAGAGAALALRKEDAPVFEGTWAGTRLTLVSLKPPVRCMRRWDEEWVITRMGDSLTANISTRAQSCGTPPEACDVACEIFTFPRDHVGTVQGSTARFFVFPEFQDASCVLTLRLQGDTLAGNMPACVTGRGDVEPMYNEVTLRRTGK